MNLIDFPQRTVIIAENQPEYIPMPAWRDPQDPAGRIICCWQLTWRERLKLLFTGKIWHHILTFRGALQPQLLELRDPWEKSS